MINNQHNISETKLWNSANELRAYGGIKSADYAVPVLGIIFLRFADNKYSQFEKEILAQYEKDKDTRMHRELHQVAIQKCGFYLPAEARYDYLLELPASESLAAAIKAAMEAIEKYQDEKFKDVLPKNAYQNIEKKNTSILQGLLKAFSDIPKNASGDVFGKIYEYFLGKFAMAEGQKGGQFFTPTSVVRFIVEVIEPYSGKIYDPACGSGGMFVQSAKFIQEANQDLNEIYVHGQEFMGETVRLAKMNLLVNNIRGEIQEINSYEHDPFESYGKFDFVMANPPFNVKSVKINTVANDQRFYEYGLPKNKGKKTDKISDANYLWVSLFATSLSAKGRAGFVMPNSASDARNAEKDIRKKIVDSGIVDVMVSMPSNMFFTVTLPATLWFFDKNKIKTKRKNKILFLDARNVYRQIDRAHRDWTEDQQQNLATIVRLYRGENKRFTDLIDTYLERVKGRVTGNDAHLHAVHTVDNALYNYQEFINDLKKWYEEAKANFTAAQQKVDKTVDFDEKLKAWEVLMDAMYEEKTKVYGGMDDFISEWKKYENASQHRYLIKWQTELGKSLKFINDAFQIILKKSGELKNELEILLSFFDKKLKVGKDKDYKNVKGRFGEYINEPLEYLQDAAELFQQNQDNIEWLLSRFPSGKYQDVVGLCKMADLKEVREEQDYSLNAGRYVGVEIEDDKISEEEFRNKLTILSQKLFEKNNQAINLESQIEKSLKELLND